jgi:hypothetical protein
MTLIDGRSDKYAIYGTISIVLATAVLSCIPGGVGLIPTVIPSIAGLWGVLIGGQKLADAKTNGATSGFAKNKQINTNGGDIPNAQNK